jgi:hypothetical protein
LVRGENEDTYAKNYFHSVKQGLYLEHGSSDAAMRLAREKQRRLWEYLIGNNASAFAAIDGELRKVPANRIPVRLVLRGGRVLQPPCGGGAEAIPLRDFISEYLSVSSGSLRAVCHGVPVCLDTPLVELWSALSFPDHFLYLNIIQVSSRPRV